MTKRSESGMVVLVAAMAFGGCAEPAKEYRVSSHLETTATPSGTLVEGTIYVHDQNTGEVRPVAAKITTHELRGLREWEVETRTLRGQKVTLKHNDAKKQMIVIVDGEAPVTLEQRADGKYSYHGNTYANNEHMRWDLAVDVAEALKDRNTEDDSVVASFEASKQASAIVGSKSKLFFAFAFVDIFTQIQTSLDMAVGSYNGTGNSNSGHCWDCYNQ